MDGRRATPCALKHPLSAYPAGVFYYESHVLLHLVRADPTMASIGVLKFVGSYLSTIEAVGTGSWLSVVQVLLDVSIALLVAIIEFHGGIHRGYRTISSEFFFVKRYMQDHLDRVSSWRKNLRLHWDPPKFFFQVEKSTPPFKKSFGG